MIYSTAHTCRSGEVLSVLAGRGPEAVRGRHCGGEGHGHVRRLHRPHVLSLHGKHTAVLVKN